MREREREREKTRQTQRAYKKRGAIRFRRSDEEEKKKEVIPVDLIRSLEQPGRLHCSSRPAHGGARGADVGHGPSHTLGRERQARGQRHRGQGTGDQSDPPPGQHSSLSVAGDTIAEPIASASSSSFGSPAHTINTRY